MAAPKYPPQGPVVPRRRGPQKRNGDLPDFGAISLGELPQQTMRVLGLVRAGHSIAHIIEIGRYQGSWDAADVRRILRANRVAIPEEPDPTPHSSKLTTARTVTLTPRQVQIVHHICQAMTNAEIAEAVGTPLPTLKSQVSDVLRATGSRDRVALVVAVLTRELVVVQEGAEP